jgi:Flp pilus assembly protein TadG
MRGLVGRFLRDTSGVAAMEFALLAPTLLMMLLAAIDLSGVLSVREAVDHVLRSGAQSAMADAGSDVVLSVMQAAASEDFTQGTGAGQITLGAQKFCACPNSPASGTSCGTICTGNLPTLTFYRMTAALRFDGILFPRFDLAPVLQVQVR